MYYLGYVLLSVMCALLFQCKEKLRYNGEINTPYALMILLAGYETVETGRGFRFRVRGGNYSFIKAKEVHEDINKLVDTAGYLLILGGVLSALLALQGIV